MTWDIVHSSEGYFDLDILMEIMLQDKKSKSKYYLLDGYSYGEVLHANL